MITTDTVLIGATFFSAGYAASAKEDCLIVERRSVVGAEFAAALIANAPHKPCGIFAEHLKELGIIAPSGGLHIVPCSIELGRFLLEQNIKLLLETEALSVTRSGDAFELTIFNRDGMQKIRATRFINTESMAASGAYRTLGAILVGGTASISLHEELGYIQYERSEEEPIFHLRLDEGDDIVSAKEKMRAVIDSGAYFGDWQIGAVASEIAWHYEYPTIVTLPDGRVSAPSSSFMDIISAMEGGASYAASNDR